MDDPPLFRKLFAEPWGFDFFQAVRLLGQLPDALARREPGGPPPEVARFKGHLALAFPASTVHDLRPPAEPGGLPTLTVTFMGLYGPSGVLPRHYTERLLLLDSTEYRRELRRKHGTDAEAGSAALRDWLDLFNHRFVLLFYRAWEKYRFFLAQEQGAAEPADPNRDPDPFTLALYSLAGLGTRGQRGRLTVSAPPRARAPGRPTETLARVRDLGLLRFAGLLAQRHRNAWGLEAILSGYFERPVEVRQHQGQWLPLEPASQTRLGDEGGNGLLGENTVVGDRVWDVQGKVRLRVGPLRYRDFLEYLPDRTPVPDRKAFFLLCHVARLYLGPEFDFEIQLVLKARDVPACRLTADEGTGPRLGWNCWVLSQPAARDAEDAVFEAAPATRVGDESRAAR